TWSPDGSRLAFASARHDTRDLDRAEDLWIAAADASGEPIKLTETVAAYLLPTWAPDGTRLAYLVSPTPTNGPRHGHLGRLAAVTGEGLDLTASLDRNCIPFGSTRSPVWDGDTLLFAVEDAGNVHLYRVLADGTGKPELVIGGQRWLSAWDAAGG